MKKLFKKVSAVIGALVLLLYLSPLAFAHPYSQEGVIVKNYCDPYSGNYYIGDEEFGWAIKEHCHTNGTTMTYSFDDVNLTIWHKDCTDAGAALWAGTVTIEKQLNGTGVGKIRTFNDASDSTIAKFCEYTTSVTTGHLISWCIRINLSRNVTPIVMAHEFGHAIGLKDLYTSQSSDKLMYFQDSTTATAPTSADIWGAKVITGVHTSHTWEYLFYQPGPGGYNKHYRRCADCGGRAANSIEGCTYGYDGFCIYCHVPMSITPWKTEPEFQ